MVTDPNLDIKTLMRLIARANEFRHKDKFREALDIYLELSNKLPENHDLRFMIAYCYFAFCLDSKATDDDVRSALSWIESAVAKKPDESRLYAILGQFRLIVAVDYEKASQAYRKAIELDPNSVEALAAAAGLYFVPVEMVTQDEAINWLERAIKLEPNNTNLHFSLGQLYRKAGRITDSEHEWIKSLLLPIPLDIRSAQTISRTYSI